MTTARGILSVIALCGVFVLTGCSASDAGPSNGDGYSVLKGKSSSADTLPSVVLKSADQVDSDTSRRVGDVDGVSFWLAKADGPGGICLIVYPNDQDWVAGCARGSLKLTGPSGSYAVYPDGTTAPDGTTRISKNVFALSR